MSKEYPQLEDDNYFRVAHTLAENLATINLSSYESRVLWAFLRLSYGWQDTDMKFPMSRVVEIVKLDRRHVYRGFKGLVFKGLIVKSNPHPKFNKKLEDWDDSVPLRAQKGCAHTDTKECASMDVKSVPIKAQPYIIERKKKEKKARPAKKELHPNHPRFIKFWTDKYLEKFEIKYSFNGGKEGNHVKSLLRDFGYEKLCTMAGIFLDSTDEWVIAQGFTLGIFYCQANKIAQKTQDRPQIQLEATPKEEIEGLYE